MSYSRLRRSSAQRKALLRDLITDLILNGKIETTETKAKELKRLADKMVTLGKTNTLHSRRQAATLIRFEKDDNNKYAIQKLEKGKFYIIPGIDIKLAKIGIKLAPTTLVSKVTYRIQKRKLFPKGRSENK